METKEVVNDYSNLVYSIISKYSFFGEIDDLYQVGMMGLLKACDNYDSQYGTKFSTYAHTYVVGEVLKYIRDNKLVKVNRDLVKLSGKIEKVREVLNQKLMREPTNQEIATFLDVGEDVVNDAIMSTNYIRSLDYEVNDEGKELNLYDSVHYEELGYNSDLIDLRNSLDSLSDEERKLIKYRYYDDETQSEVSKKMGMSQVQVSRTEAKILQKLKNRLS